MCPSAKALIEWKKYLKPIALTQITDSASFFPLYFSNCCATTTTTCCSFFSVVQSIRESSAIVCHSLIDTSRRFYIVVCQTLDCYEVITNKRSQVTFHNQLTD